MRVSASFSRRSCGAKGVDLLADKALFFRSATPAPAAEQVEPCGSHQPAKNHNRHRPFDFAAGAA